MSAVDNHGLIEKSLNFCGNHSNTNFGEVQQNSKGNLINQLKTQIEKGPVCIGNAERIVHRCLQIAFDVLLTNLETLIAKTS